MGTIYGNVGLYLTPEDDIEEDFDDTPVDLASRMKAASETIRLLEEEGLDMDLADCDEDRAMAELITQAYILDAEDTSKSITSTEMSQISAGTVKQVSLILNTFGMMVAKRSEEIRNTVINKLLLLTEDSDKRIQLRALENLGKIGEVGLFTDRKDVHVTHHSPDETRQALREKLIELKKQSDGSYAVHPPSEEEIEQAVGVMDD